MNAADRYHRFVRWSEEDQAYVGYCPDLYFGGICHGDAEESVYAELCDIVRSEVEHRLDRGETLPEPRVRAMRELSAEV
jgi:predicted RNase H-like HicB family nuclease